MSKRKVIAAEIVHGNTVAVVDAYSPEMILGADALVTQDRTIVLSVTVADCIPVYWYDPHAEIAALAHCGWRGIVAGVAQNTTQKILDLGARPEHVRVAFGPGINECHFEIQENSVGAFEEYQTCVIRRDGRIFVNLKAILHRQLLALGIENENIEDSRECTLENPQKYFSFRRDKPEKVEAMVAVLGMK